MPAARSHHWLTVRQSAEYSGFASRTIRKRIAAGDLPAYTPRGSRLLRIDINDLDAMIMADGRVPSAHLADGQPAARRLTQPRPRKTDATVPAAHLADGRPSRPRARKGDGHAA